MLQVDRMELGLFGDSRPVGGGLSELRIDVGPGYRVYYRGIGEQRVLIFCGGDKSKQQADIVRAKRYWQEFQRRKAGGG
jgi:putative addiction module killer protein